jgi:hypothetical protein
MRKDPGEAGKNHEEERYAKENLLDVRGDVGNSGMRDDGR